jgi:competence protein ComEC
MKTTDIYILNVGAGSCIVTKHPSGRASMIDINNGGELRDYEYSSGAADSVHAALSEAAAAKAELTNPIDWYRHWIGTDLWRFVLSHPDADHMSGLRCLFDGHISPTVFWDLEHSKALADESDYQNANAYHDALWYDLWRTGNAKPDYAKAWPQRISPLRFASRDFWAQDEIEILSPSRNLLTDRDASHDWNNMSYVLRINYGGRSVLIPGDVEEAGWDDLAAACDDNDVSLKTDVLVASHHGRRSGYPENGVLAQIDPHAVIVSAGKMDAAHDAIRRYRDNVEHVYSTRTEGSLMVRLREDGSLAIWRGVDTFEEDDLAILLDLAASARSLSH